jgi:sulfonate transport system ATP-binding protein
LTKGVVVAADPGGLNTAVPVRGLTRRFDARIVLERVDLDIPPGQFVALLGQSGVGKSTLLRALAGLDRDTAGSGQISVPKNLSVVFQDVRLLPWKRVLGNVMFGLSDADPRQAAAAALAEVGLAGRERPWPSELSGGEQQRVALARSLARQPQLLLADEPFGALDALTRIGMHDLLRRLCERHRPTVLLITHDVDEAIYLAQRVLVLDHAAITVDLPESPRERAGRFAEIRTYLLDELGVRSGLRETLS